MRIAVVGKYPPAAEGISDYAQHVVTSLARRPEVERVTVIASQIAGAVQEQPLGHRGEGRGDVRPHPDPSLTSPDPFYQKGSILPGGEGAGRALPKGEAMRGGRQEGEGTGRVDVRRVWRANTLDLSPRVAREILRARPDVVWYNVSLAMFGESPLALTGFLLPALTRCLGIRSVVTLHERPVDDLGEVGAPGGVLRRLGLDLAVRLLLGSDVVAVTVDRFGRTLRASRLPGRAEVVYLPLCGYDEPTLEPFEDPATALMLTSHAPHKNLPLLLDAFERARTRVPAARLAIAGIDHPRFPGYLAGVQRIYRDRVGVEWLGPVPTVAMRATFRRAAVTVAPYRVATGSSATVHRAVSLGRPVVVADLPEFRWMAEEEDLWLEYFPRDDATALANVLARLLTDPRRCQEIARHNHRSARRNSLAATTDAYLRLFRGARAPSLVTSVSYSASGGLSP